MNRGCHAFGRRWIRREDVSGKRVLEVGSCDVNGSLRPMFEALGPASYVGVDVVPGTGVDELCEAGHVAARFGREAFDYVVCTEVLEHIRDWRGAVSNMKAVLASHGLLLLTTRSRGFGFHGYPFDFWRYEVADVAEIFSDFTIVVLEPDPTPDQPGVLMLARKPPGFRERETTAITVYSMVAFRRVRDVTAAQVRLARALYFVRGVVARMVPRAVKRRIRRHLTARRACQAGEAAGPRRRGEREGGR